MSTCFVQSLRLDFANRARIDTVRFSSRDEAVMSLQRAPNGAGLLFVDPWTRHVVLLRERHTQHTAVRVQWEFHPQKTLFRQAIASRSSQESGR